MIFPGAPDPAPPSRKLLRVRCAPPVSRQPSIVLREWRVLAHRTDRHIVGLTPYGSWRTSTRILQWDAASRMARTASGRCYFLYAELAGGADVGSVPVEGVTDVTGEYLPGAAAGGEGTRR